MRNRGFTTIELSMTLVLTGVVLGLGLQRVDSSSWRLDAAGQQVVQRVRAARALAVLKQHDVVLSFDIDGRALQLHEDANGNGVVDDGERVFREGLDGKSEFTNEGIPAFRGFEDGPVTFENNVVTFRRNGSASQEGAIYVGRPGAEKGRVIVISRATGYAEMHKHNGTSWISG
jgi:Tfp pilus assembly protein FimT